MSLSGEDCSVSNSGLWQAIRNVPLPDVVTPKDWFRSSKTETFQERLSSEHDLTEESARRLVEEYRRFLYLKAIDGGSLTPSERVDQAWHLHMETAGEGWAQFCDDVLKFRIDHRTGLSRKEAMASYSRLLQLYRREFNQEPPGDIWPGERERMRNVIGGGMVFAAVVLFLFGFGLYPFIGVAGQVVWVGICMVLFLVGGGMWDDTDLERVAKCA